MQTAVLQVASPQNLHNLLPAEFLTIVSEQIKRKYRLAYRCELKWQTLNSCDSSLFRASPENRLFYFFPILQKERGEKHSVMCAQIRTLS